MGTVYAKSEDRSNNNFGDSLESFARNEREPPKSREDIQWEGVKARVDKIHIDGLARTKDDIVEDCIRDLFKATDFQDVLLRAHRARVKLDELGCFKNISVFIDTSKGQNATPDGLEITFNVKELKRLTGGISTQVGNNEGALLVGMKAPNLFGRGERIQVEYSHGSKKTSNFNVGFVKPFRGKHRPVLTTSVFQAHSEWPSSGYKLVERGLLFDFGFHSSSLIKHNIQWEADIRDMNCLSRSTAFEVREQTGLSLKSALKHILSLDLRDDFIFPSSGSLFQVTSEFAGVGGDVGFIKNDLFLQTNVSILEDFVVQGTLTGGIVNATSPDMKIGMSDLFYLGGPLSVRGFQTRGLGPHSDGNAVGSLGFWAAGLHLFAPLPFRPGRGGFGELFRTHLFVNGGNVGEFRLDDSGSLLETLQKNARVSWGLGIALRLGNMARLEVNYCFPLIFSKSDHTQPGVQFGVGVRFL
ncbi:sorting and assembly machinery component 50 homolog [Aethina tumida]|uniref:sorting and assembly machinery component 50 homolog n=1 Tax=Aethina tumida TaxID=116153 RepID=UPI00096B2304|nr:sorting and assembly machinery component 50 homolog [Aethina tumida]